MENMKSQFFCGLGLPKTGTTWIANYLTKHPDIYMPEMKELQVFNRRFRPDLYEYMDSTIAGSLTQVVNRLISKDGNSEKLADKTALIAEALALPHHPSTKYMMRAYRRLFRGRLTPEQAVFGEFSTTYCVLPSEGIKLLDSAFPQTLYIMVLRDPVDRFWSHVKHQSRLKEHFDPLTQYEEMFSNPEMVEMADYRRIINKFQRIIPAERIHYVIYEDLFVEHNQAALKSVTSFLGVPFIPGNLDEVVYQGSKSQMPDKFRAIAMEKFQDSYSIGKELLGRMPDHWGDY